MRCKQSVRVCIDNGKRVGQGAHVREKQQITLSQITQMKNEISNAISESIKRDRIVLVQVETISAGLAEVRDQADDVDSTSENPAEDGTLRQDVWGELDGEDFRLTLTAKTF